MARSRDLSPKEKALWDAVAKTAKPNANRDLPKATPVGPHAERVEQDKPKQRHPLVGEPVASAVPEPKAEPKSDPAGLHNLDRRTAERLKKGRITIDGTLDLHGMTRERAHAALVRYIPAQRQRGARMVLVITGTGRGRSYDGKPLPVADAPWERSAHERFQMPTRSGVLRRDVPLWLEEPGLRQHVVAITQAQPKHGGMGALYVYLKRDRG